MPAFSVNLFGPFLKLFMLFLISYKILLLLPILCNLFFFGKKNRYKVIRTDILNQKQALALRKSEKDFDFWRPIKSGFSTDVLIPPILMKHMEKILKQSTINHTIVIGNVQNLIKVQNSRTHQPGYTGKINFNEYYSHDDVSLCI